MKITIFLAVFLSCIMCGYGQSSPRVVVLDSVLIFQKASFPSCHASTICETADGSMLAAFFGGSYEGAADVAIWTSRLIKGSKYWTPPKKVATGIDSQGAQVACWNPVLYRVPGPNDQVMLFYKSGARIPDWVGHVLHSKDGGRTWQINHLPKGQLGAIKNKPLKVGRKIIAPSSIEPDWQPRFEISTNNGRTWNQVLVPRDTTIIAIQPALLQLPNDTILALCRTKNGFLAQTYSTDGGSKWSPMTLTDIPNNNSGIDAITLSNGLHVMVYTPCGLVAGTEFGPRTPLVLGISRDGHHWTPILTLENQPGEYSYPSIVQSQDGTLHIVYTFHRTHIKYVHIRLEE